MRRRADPFAAWCCSRVSGGSGAAFVLRIDGFGEL